MEEVTAYTVINIPKPSVVRNPNTTLNYLKFIHGKIHKLGVKPYLSFDIPDKIASELYTPLFEKGYYFGRYVKRWDKGLMFRLQGTYEPVYAYYLAVNKNEIPDDAAKE